LNCKSGFPTSPGTEINVIPEIAVPIIPKATKYHFEFLLALKKVSLSELFLLTILEMKINNPKYIMIKDKMAIGDIIGFLVVLK
jgi:hypothetical protein